MQLVSVISLLASDSPNLESPANIDAAKELRTEPESMCYLGSYEDIDLTLYPAYKKKVRRLVRRSAEEAFD